LGGGVELTLLNLGQGLRARGHQVTVVAPEGSSLADVAIAAVSGQLQPTAHTQGRSAPIVLPGDSALGNMWRYARQHQGEVDLIVNFAYDWLPFYLTDFFQTPVAHFVSMGSLSDAMDEAIGQVARQFSNRLGAYTRTQAETFGITDAFEISAAPLTWSSTTFAPPQATPWPGWGAFLLRRG
jgi:UDP-glucose:tetrahydrobiopterin glucosyltransferase